MVVSEPKAPVKMIFSLIKVSDVIIFIFQGVQMHPPCGAGLSALMMACTGIVCCFHALIKQAIKRNKKLCAAEFLQVSGRHHGPRANGQTK